MLDLVSPNPAAHQALRALRRGGSAVDAVTAAVLAAGLYMIKPKKERMLDIDVPTPGMVEAADDHDEGRDHR